MQIPTNLIQNEMVHVMLGGRGGGWVGLMMWFMWWWGRMYRIPRGKWCPPLGSHGILDDLDLLLVVTFNPIVDHLELGLFSRVARHDVRPRDDGGGDQQDEKDEIFCIDAANTSHFGNLSNFLRFFFKLMYLFILSSLLSFHLEINNRNM